MKRWHVGTVLLLVIMVGCSTNTAGTEGGARKYFDAEFQKWMAGEKNAVSTMESRINLLKEPISYDIRSVVTGEPDFLAGQDASKLPDDWRTWPAYKFNVAIEWKSKGGAPVKSVTTYTLTWNASEKRWYATELR